MSKISNVTCRFVTTLATFAVAASCRTTKGDSEFTSTEGQRIIPIGSAYNFSKGEYLGYGCFDLPPDAINRQLKVINDGNVTISKVNDLQDVRNTMGGSLAASLEMEGLNISGEVKLLKDQATNGYDLTYAVVMTTGEGAEGLSQFPAMTLKDSARAKIKALIDTGKSPPDAFVETCGTHIVTQRVLYAGLLGTFTVRFGNRAGRSSFEAQLQAQYDGIEVFGSGFMHALKRSRTLGVTMDVTQFGGLPSRLVSTMSGSLPHISNCAKGVGGEAEAQEIAASLGFENAPASDQELVDREKVLESCEKVIGTISAYLPDFSSQFEAAESGSLSPELYAVKGYETRSLDSLLVGDDRAFLHPERLDESQELHVRAMRDVLAHAVLVTESELARVNALRLSGIVSQPDVEILEGFEIMAKKKLGIIKDKATLCYENPLVYNRCKKSFEEFQVAYMDPTTKIDFSKLALTGDATIYQYCSKLQTSWCLKEQIPPESANFCESVRSSVISSATADNQTEVMNRARDFVSSFYTSEAIYAILNGTFSTLDVLLKQKLPQVIQSYVPSAGVPRVVSERATNATGFLQVEPWQLNCYRVGELMDDVGQINMDSTGLQDLTPLKVLPTLTMVTFNSESGKIDPTPDLESLASVPSLRGVWLTSTRLRPEAIGQLKVAKKIRLIGVEKAFRIDLKDASFFRMLEGFPVLQFASVTGNEQITTLGFLGHNPRLTELDIRGTSVTLQEVEGLGKLTESGKSFAREYVPKLRKIYADYELCGGSVEIQDLPGTKIEVSCEQPNIPEVAKTFGAIVQ